jgi:hypothetical protein
MSVLQHTPSSATGSLDSPQIEPFVPDPVSALMSELSDGAYRLLSLIIHRIGRNPFCWASQASFAEDMRCSVRTVRNRQDELIAAGWITVENRGNRTNLYRLANRQDSAGLTGNQLPTEEEPKNKNHQESQVVAVVEPPRLPDHTTPTVTSVTPRRMEPVVQISTSPQPIPLDWTPDEHLVTALKNEHPDVDIDLALANFVSFQYENERTAKVWDLKFRAWVLGDVKHDKAEAKARPSDKIDPITGCHSGVEQQREINRRLFPGYDTLRVVRATA